MRYELTDQEWTNIKPDAANKPRGVPRVIDRRVLNASSGCWIRPWRELPMTSVRTHLLQPLHSLATGGVWGPIMDALATAHVASVQMIELDCLCFNPSGPWPADLRASFARLDPTKRRGMK